MEMMGFLEYHGIPAFPTKEAILAAKISLPMLMGWGDVSRQGLSRALARAQTTTTAHAVECAVLGALWSVCAEAARRTTPERGTPLPTTSSSTTPPTTTLPSNVSTPAPSLEIDVEYDWRGIYGNLSYQIVN